MSNNDSEYLIVPWDIQNRGVSSEARSHILRSRNRTTKRQACPPAARPKMKKCPSKETATLIHPITAPVIGPDEASMNSSSSSPRPHFSESSTPMTSYGDSVVLVQEQDTAADVEESSATISLTACPERLLAINTGTTVGKGNLLMNACNPINKDFLRYFKQNAKSMLLLGHCSDSKKAEGIVQTLLSHALSGTWCFGSIVILLSANYLNFESGHEPPDQFTRIYIDLIREESLICASNTVKAVGEGGVSCDDDVLALLFLAIAECLYGDLDRGRVHMRGWQAYMDERDTQCASPCTKAVQDVIRWVCGLIPI